MTTSSAAAETIPLLCPPDEAPLRASATATEDWDRQGAEVARGLAAQRIRRGTAALRQRLDQNAAVLRAAYQELSAAASERQAVTPGAEWILDNAHVIEDQLAATREALPHRRSQALPRLIEGSGAGSLRIGALASYFIAHSDCVIALEPLTRYLRGAQTVAPLELSELWALPTVLRLALLENLRRLARRIVWSQNGRRLADDYADRLLLPGSREIVLALPEMHDWPPSMSIGFAVQLLHRLQFHEGQFPLTLQALGERLATLQHSAASVTIEEHRAQRAANLTIRNLIISMRLIGATDWRRAVENLSLPHQVLARDAVYRGCDLGTRELCRQAVAELARWTHSGEQAVAELVLAQPGDASSMLLGPQRVALERQLDVRLPTGERCRRALRAGGLLWYAPAILALTALGSASLLAWPAIAPTRPALWLALAIALWWPVSEVATALVNALTARLLPPRPLPRLDLQSVPDTARTLVVIPCLLSSRRTLHELLRQIEAHHLNNVDPNVYLALLSDWVDADHAQRPDDAELFNAARAGIDSLNQRHAAGEARFLLLHRQRRWDAAEQRWMGWERKRGKLHELNRLLRGATDTAFTAGACSVPSNVRYVVTLDADTRMQMGTVTALLAIALHPLQRPRSDATGRIIAGYAMLQPRVTPTLPRRAERSLFEHLYASAAGLDPYAGAVSDVYQDLFGSGIYIGKGLYQVDAFEAALAGRVPDNTLLSHDLLEGSFARCALVADVEFFDEFPAHAEVAAERQHRWARGDWQLLPWLLGPRGRGLPALARWQMLDNLRRTLIAPALLAAMVLLWCLQPAAGLWISALALALLAAPVIAGSLLRSRRALYDAAALAATGFALLAHYAWLMIDAICRSLWRMAVSKRHRLEWISAAQAKHGKGVALDHFSWPLRSATIVVIAVAGIVVLLGGQSLAAVSPTLLLWWLAPVVARELSRRRPAALAAPLSADDKAALRRIGRRTWRYFTQFVTDADHHLPPDNFQEDPTPRVAHRTSPTNIGLYLLSCVSARDLGWLGEREFIARVSATLDTLDRLERCDGHFLNWYDTQTLAPLAPRYVSTVDSGNLAGYLIALACACDSEAGNPAVRAEALRDTLAIFDEELARHEPALRNELQAQLVTAAAANAQTPGGMSVLHESAAALVNRLRAEARDNAGLHPDLLAWAEELEHAIARCAPARETGGATQRAQVATRARDMARNMNFRMLFDAERELFSIGWRVEDGTLDRSHYDLLASEARLASFLAIAWGQVPPLHWQRLARGLADTPAGPALESWSGSMFEYLMPSLVMATPRDSLIEVTARRAVAAHIAWGRQHRLPWGVSEAAYAVRDREHTYQYRAFGVPQLGLKAGLQADQVVAPYATALASLCAPQAALANFMRLRAQGALGSYGYYESIDYTPERLRDDAPVLVRAYMAHHQGMSIAAIHNAVQGQRLRRRFHGDPHVYAAELLLQEMFPRSIRVRTLRAAAPPVDRVRIGEALTRRFITPHLDRPALQLLSNGEFAVALTAAGGGFSRWRHLAVTRWREDPTLDDWGSFIYIVDLDSEHLWSATYQPTAVEPERYEVLFQEDRVRFTREDHGIFSELEVVVAPDDPVELRRLRLRNRSTRMRRLAICSYLEPVLASQDADLAHPAFSNLFIETEYLPDSQTLLAVRRPRDATDAHFCVGHSVVSTQTQADSPSLQFETARAAFIGRGRTRRRPRALDPGAELSNGVGAVLDPALAFRIVIQLAPDAEHDLNFATFAAEGREAALQLAQRYGRHTDFERSSQLAWTHARIQLTHIGVDLVEAQAFQRLATRIVFSQPAFRPGQRILNSLSRPASALWRFGISGDLPIMVWRFTQAEQRSQLLQAFRAHAYWRSKRMAVDLVILNDEPASYAQPLQAELDYWLRGAGPALAHGPGQIHLLRGTQLDDMDRWQLLAAARAVIDASQGSLMEQLGRQVARPQYVSPPATLGASMVPQLSAPWRPERATHTHGQRLQLFNGIGGVDPTQREYVITLTGHECTPAPWVNVIANPVFGTVVSESGGGYSWCGNSRENPLTPWSNDPVIDPPGETFYLFEADTGVLWTPTALPVRHDEHLYRIHHGRGYTRFEHLSHDIDSELLVMVAPDQPVKISRLRVHNRSNRSRKLLVTAYVEWSLGPSRTRQAHFIRSSWDEATGALLARNPWNIDAGQRVAFFDLCGRQQWGSADRTEFLGRHGSQQRPQGALSKLSGRSGAGLDPCAALQLTLTLAPGASADVTALLGQGENIEAVQQLIGTARGWQVDQVLAQLRAQWSERLDTIQIETPDTALNVLTNDWLLYQVWSARYWGRAGFYQAGGAYGFRDQLQDGQALLLSAPEITREHLLRAAARQFIEGDVQHWWHPPGGRGVRTHISDDRIWLAHCIERYLRVTGDSAVLDQHLPFLEGPGIPEGREDAYFEPAQSAQSATLYEHAALALDASLALGPNGLPLIGSGDWNDGMNRVGAQGRGESVWLAWFLSATLDGFAPIAAARGEAERAQRWQSHAAQLRATIEAVAWDGQWYRRAIFDDGTVLGTASASECRIDAIAQSWSVLANGLQPERSRQAMDSAATQLADEELRILRLLAPPFDLGATNPGYIRGYVPGVRENGAQYTHAAAWTVIAALRLGDIERGWRWLQWLNPLHRSRDETGMRRYAVEPYVLAADIYAAAGHGGRGGWTWYTGAAGWLYRAIIEELIGLRIEADALEFAPKLPGAWPGVSVRYRRDGTLYRIEMRRDGPGSVLRQLSVDGLIQPQQRVLLRPGAGECRIELLIG